MNESKTDLVVLGAGPGGYAAAFYAADRGLKVTLVDHAARLGGVCLNEGCIPSKALLHATELIRRARASARQGITFGPPTVEIAALAAWKDSVLEKLGQGIAQLAQRRNITVLRGRGFLENSGTLRVETAEGQKFIPFDKAILAVGSRPALPTAFDLGSERIMTSTQALELKEIPQDLLVVGGGYIGLELGTIYAALGSRVVLAEALPALLYGVDPDLVQPVTRFARENFKELRLQATVGCMKTDKRKILVTMEWEGKQSKEHYDRVLVAVGRVPNCTDIGLENTKVKTDDKGFIQVNASKQTADSALYAIGDAAGGVLLAHKASREARIAVDAMLGEPPPPYPAIIPAVVFTDPEVAWCGLTESEAREKGIPVKIVRFPWSASGRALTLDRPDGVTKLIVDTQTERILGVGIAGHGAGELISESVVAIEMGATVKDLAECVHPHPTLSETLTECAEMFYGLATHALVSRRPAPETPGSSP